MKTLEQFLLEANNLSYLKNKYDLEKSNIYEFDNKISIDLIIVKDKNKGTGSKVMKEICEYADKNNKIIILSPSNEFGSSKKRLIEFYKRFGFIENKDKNKIPGIFETMYRMPQK